MNPEVFYIHTHGEQRGPYTLPQIDHLLNSGLINEDTLFWREGLEQWQPVTSLVVRKKKPGVRWRKPAIVLGSLLLIFGLLARVFGPITLQGWRETNQHDFTAEAAYWRARGVVRSSTLPEGTLVEFAPFEQGAVQLNGATTAKVMVRGEVTDAAGATRAATWNVDMVFDPAKREWTGGPAVEVASTQ